ncbi:MAG: hypothetical protein K2O10_01805, partial [Muribaculaceae bacterium]|nr:hypothetical protein [Muribaculaceae bacterium]
RSYRGNLEWDLVRIKLLQETRGNLIKGITRNLSAKELRPELSEVLLEQAQAGGERGGHLTIRLFDPESARTVKLQSTMRLPMNKNLVNILDSMDVSYNFDKF